MFKQKRQERPDTADVSDTFNILGGGGGSARAAGPLEDTAEHVEHSTVGGTPDYGSAELNMSIASLFFNHICTFWTVLKKRGEGVLERFFLVRRPGGEPLLKRGRLASSEGGDLKHPVQFTKEFDTP